MNISNAINTVSVSGSSSSSAKKTSEKNKWQLTDSLKEKIVELAKKDAKNNIYMGNEFTNLRKAEVAKVAPNRAALIDKFNQSMSSGNMGDMKEIQEADKMAVSGVNGIRVITYETKSKRTVNSAEKFIVEETDSTQEMSEAEEMKLFKKEFYEDLSKITNHRTVSNAAVNISEEAFKAMKDDPQYREKVLSLIQRDWGDSYAPRNCSVLITVGATLNEYRADSWPVGYDSEFDMRSQNSFYKRTSEKKDRQKELLEEYLKKRAQAKKQQQEMLNKKIAKMELERSRLTQSWNSERQMAKASNAYDANIMMEAELVKNITKGEKEWQQ